MGRVNLLSGSYKAKSVIANYQRRVNLYPEKNPDSTQAPVPVTHYPTPGITKIADPPTPGMGRGIYEASTGDCYAVIGSNVYYIAPNYRFILLGHVSQNNNIVRMSDNGIELMIVDGSSKGYTIDLTTRVFSIITDPNFYGSNTVDYADTYFLLGRPRTNQWYISLSNSSAFDPLDLAAKTGAPDPVTAVVALHREVWLIGAYTTEIWYDSGAADFAYAAMPGAMIEHGCLAPYSVIKIDVGIFWLSHDKQGHRMVLMGTPYTAARVSNHAIEAEFNTYAYVNDAVAYSYQLEGHVFYVLSFPSADKTWVYDLSTSEWHEWNWMDNDGVLHRHRGVVGANPYDTNLILDWETGTLYKIDPTRYTDNGQPIVRIAGLPHVSSNGDKSQHRQLTVDIEVGTSTDGGPTTELQFQGNIGAGPVDLNFFGFDYPTNNVYGQIHWNRVEGDYTIQGKPPMISMRWSDTKGHSWGNWLMQSMGWPGEYLTTVSFNRLGIGRDRVYELSWSEPVKTALNGVWLEFTKLES